jgi:erythromycin esterase
VSDRDDVRTLARPLRDPGDLDPLLDRIGRARVVLLGEASHGTHEYYAWRTAITRRLVQEFGFSFVAVEGDWPDCHRVHCAVTLAADRDPREVLRGYERWPTWMWANEEVAELSRWLRTHNASRDPADRVGFHGLDVYSLWDSLRAIIGYLEEHEPAAVGPAIEAFRCFEPYGEDPQEYARATALVPTTCEAAVVDVLRVLREAPPPADGGPARDAAFVAEQNARVAAGAEAYYRAMVTGGPQSWNVRDTHMADTLDRLLEHYDGRGTGAARAVVWEHNTHVGDARYTDMRDAGMVNVGQLARERHGEEDVVIVGFGSHHGSVIAGSSWGAPMQRMPLPPARDGSVEALLHDTVPDATASFVVPPDPPDWLVRELPHRAVGVVYRAQAERWGNYVPTVLGRRYDAFLWFDESRALSPLAGTHAVRAELETYPSGG